MRELRLRELVSLIWHFSTATVNQHIESIPQIGLPLSLQTAILPSKLVVSHQKVAIPVPCMDSHQTKKTPPKSRIIAL